MKKKILISLGVLVAIMIAVFGFIFVKNQFKQYAFTSRVSDDRIAIEQLELKLTAKLDSMAASISELESIRGEIKQAIGEETEKLARRQRSHRSEIQELRGELASFREAEDGLRERAGQFQPLNLNGQ